MEPSRLGNRWLAACAIAAVLANLAGGFSVAVTVVFIVLCLTGLALIAGEGDSVPGAVDDDAFIDDDAEPYPDDDVSDDEADVVSEPTDAEVGS